MKTFISCDWGTSALRLRLVDVSAETVLAEVISSQGILNTFELWKKTGKAESERSFFYQSVLKEEIKNLEQSSGTSLQNVPIIISGMASSNIGMIELPYKEMPFSIDGSDLQTKKVDATDEFRHLILMISGVRTEDDVMRGEETQLIGCINENNKKNQLFIFPGTHSKHIVTNGTLATDFKTYMTGEFFDLLSSKSILSSSVEKGEGLKDKNNKLSFEAGVKEGRYSNILHTSFSVRTNHLFKKLSKAENYYYLSGLLIGAELTDVKDNSDENITLVANENMGKYYSSALSILGFKEELNFFMKNADEALIKGQIEIYRRLNE